MKVCQLHEFPFQIIQGKSQAGLHYVTGMRILGDEVLHQLYVPKSFFRFFVWTNVMPTFFSMFFNHTLFKIFL